VIPAALAAAEREGSGGIDLLDALIKGYEATIRIGTAAGPAHYRHWYSTATCGVFGAAAACAHVLGLDRPRSLDALGQAGMMSAGLWQCRSEPTDSKQLATGRSAQAGLLAADLARQNAALNGFTDRMTVIDGEVDADVLFSSAAKMYKGLQKANKDMVDKLRELKVLLKETEKDLARERALNKTMQEKLVLYELRGEPPSLVDLC
jgi:2-methylcitrate dehydratase PrpD